MKQVPYIGRDALDADRDCGLLGLGHAVADARLGEDVGGDLGVIAQLAPEVLYHGAQRPQVGLTV